MILHVLTSSAGRLWSWCAGKVNAALSVGLRITSSAWIATQRSRAGVHMRSRRTQLRLHRATESNAFQRLACQGILSDTSKAVVARLAFRAVELLAGNKK